MISSDYSEGGAGAAVCCPRASGDRPRGVREAIPGGGGGGVSGGLRRSPSISQPGPAEGVAAILQAAAPTAVVLDGGPEGLKKAVAPLEASARRELWAAWQAAAPLLAEALVRSPPEFRALGPLLEVDLVFFWAI